jgi:hypothetical protein
MIQPGILRFRFPLPRQHNYSLQTLNLRTWASLSCLFIQYNSIPFFAGPLSFDTKGYVGGLPKLMYNQDSWTKVNIYYFSLSLQKNSVCMAKCC